MKLALIIGGSRGLGRALVEQYRAQGWEVLSFARTDTGVGHVHLDVANHDVQSYTQLIDQLVQQQWNEVVLINNAATVLPIKPVAALNDAELLHSLQVNFVAAIRLIQHFVAAFATHPARKVVAQISSGAAQKAYRSWSLYCASKAGVDHFMAALALEQQSSSTPIISIVIDPDVMDTEMQATIRKADPADFPDLARFIARQQQGLLRDPAQVAQFCRDVIASAEQGARYDIDG